MSAPDTPVPPIVLHKKFSEVQIIRILEQAAIYACACPAQVCKAINQQRSLFNYQARCIDNSATDLAVHQRIAESTQRTHAELEACLQDVLDLEGWDMTTLTMPKGLAKRLADSIDEMP